jgi:hypothetical protein
MKLEETVLTAKTSRWVALGFLGRKPMLIYLLIMILALIVPLIMPEYSDLMLLGYGLLGLYVLLFLGRLFGFKREKVDLESIGKIEGFQESLHIEMMKSLDNH